ncbi:hypothetical protein SZN_16385 [Streptomyces zinciresistens K42]|uniref:Uncharacterized protein n=1 Tax=Streptomyces zinciresistens K42 TaxID=700597 RepID=G2GCQ2_9ACTN|nr:hypothetical protein [Streptomyces zinciresistens]EGX58713.1 hypothetical protein SZN_16385 [Streptomyces zinciresistens K42]
MDIAEDLALTERLCARAFPAQRGGPDAGAGGPGWFMVELSAGSRHGPEDLYAYEAALVQRFEERWGEGSRWGSATLLERAARGEELPEPWALFASRADDLRTWEAAGTGRWVSLAVADRDPEAVPALLLMVTDIDPP